MAVLAQDLRDAVLQAALEGKLTKRLNTDSSVIKLIDEIKNERQLIAEKKKARGDNLKGTIDDDELLLNGPKEWGYLRLGEIGVYKKGPFGSALTKSIFVPKSSNTIKVYEQKNAIQKDATLGEYYITKEYYDEKMKGFTVESGDIIVSCAGTIGESYVLPNDIELGIINQALMRMTIVSILNIDYFLLYFDFVLKNEARGKSKGGAIKNIPPFDVLKNLPVPIPPLEEQQRIVDRVEELMAKIDEYEAIENKLVALKKAFPQEMKDALLQAGFDGSLIDEGNESWREDTISELCNIVNGFTPKRSVDEYWNKNEIPWFTIEDVHEQGRFISHTSQYITNKALGSNSKRLVPPDSILLCCTASIGEYAYTNISLTTNQQFNALIIKDKELIRPMYLYYYVQTLKRKILGNAGKTTFPFLSTKKLGEFTLPVPSINKQEKVVKRLETLLPLCDKLAELN